mgnify:CR=1 FL=1
MTGHSASVEALEQQRRQTAAARSLVALNDVNLVQCIDATYVKHASMSEAATEAEMPTTVMAYAFIPNAVLFQMRFIIWDRHPKGRWSELSMQKLLAFTVADFCGRPAPWDPETAGQRMDDFLTHKPQWCHKSTDIV